MRHQSLRNRFQRSTIYRGGPTEMKRSTLSLIIVAIILCAAPLLLAAAKVGDPAPTFTATASDGKTYKLGDYRGNMSSSSGTTTAALTSANNTTAATCRSSKSNGRARA